MTLIPNCDYFVYYERLPWSIRGMISINNDTTYTIFLNSRYPMSILQKTLHHELNHILNNDFYNDLSIEEVEGLY